MKTIFYSCIISLLALIACKEENENQKAPIYAGKVDAGLFHIAFDPALQLDFIFDSLGNFHYGTDSIDINLDGDFDIIIKQRIMHDSIMINVNNYSFCSLTMKNGWEVASIKDTYPVGLGQFNNIYWVDTLLYKTRIDNLTEWSGTADSRWMWVIPPVEFTGSYGSWYHLAETERYVGIRITTGLEFKYGWIKVFQIDREDIRFISYAYEK